MPRRPRAHRRKKRTRLQRLLSYPSLLFQALLQIVPLVVLQQSLLNATFSFATQFSGIGTMEDQL